jgi:hypothetical protein
MGMTTAGGSAGSGFASSTRATTTSALRSRIRAVTSRSARAAFRTSRSGAASTVTEARNALICSASSATDSPPSGAFSDWPSYSRSCKSAN